MYIRNAVRSILTLIPVLSLAILASAQTMSPLLGVGSGFA